MVFFVFDGAAFIVAKTATNIKRRTLADRMSSGGGKVQRSNLPLKKRKKRNGKKMEELAMRRPVR